MKEKFSVFNRGKVKAFEMILSLKSKQTLNEMNDKLP